MSAQAAALDSYRACRGSLTARDHFAHDLDRDALPGVPSFGKVSPRQMELVRQFLDLHEAWETYGYHMCGWSAPDDSGFNLHWQSCSYLDHDEWGATFSFSWHQGWKLAIVTDPKAHAESAGVEGWTEVLSEPAGTRLHRSEDFAEYLQRFKAPASSRGVVELAPLLAEVINWGQLRAARLREQIRQNTAWLRCFGSVDGDGDEQLTAEHVASRKQCEAELARAEQALAVVERLATVEDENIVQAITQGIRAALEVSRV